jgi:FAD/FMN-containing dehydrogenase
MATTAIDRLEERFAGELVRPGDESYDRLRQVFNGMIDRRPRLIARCTGALDVAAAVEHAHENRLPLAVFGGGHGVRGHAVCDEGIVIDLRPMKGCVIDQAARTAHAQAGLTWGELDAKTQAFGLAVTGGRVSSTGIAGLTLGSGSGWLERKLGLSADNLLSAELVLADGRIVTASEREHRDLFWALRGGSGNFGVVTSFEFRLHEVGPIVLGGIVLHPASRGPALMRLFRDFMAAAPDEVGGAVALVTAPPDPLLPDAVRGKPAAALIACYAGSVDEGERILAPLRQFGPPALDMVAPMQYTQLQRLLDQSNPAGRFNYWGGDFLTGLPDDAIEIFCAAHRAAPSPHSMLVVLPGGGQLARVPDDTMALGQRTAPFNTHLIAMWEDPADSEANIRWIRDLGAASRPYTTGGGFLNFLGEEGAARVRRAFGEEKYRRLVEIKDRYDPHNLFRLNQNIPPSSAAREG